MRSKRIAAASRAAARGNSKAEPRLHTPVPVRPRHDGWSPEKQTAFIEALAESGCVAHACQRVGMQPQSAYALRRRVDAQHFRIAWELALDYAVQRLAEAALSRAIHGVAVPVFFQGEQIGERRYFDEHLTRFILRCRDPVRYGAWIDRAAEARQHPGAPAIRLARGLNNLDEANFAADAGVPPFFFPIDWPDMVDLEDQRAADRAREEDAREAADQVKRDAEFEAYLRGLAEGAKTGESGPT